MEHLHKHLRLFPEDELQVRHSAPAEVFLMDDDNYRLYRQGEEFDYYGGLSSGRQVSLRVPYAGQWHLVVEQAQPGRGLDVVVQIIQG